MSWIIEDSELAKRNQSLVMCGGGIAYNAVISVKFSDENTTEPITLQQAKDWLRIDVIDDDTLITALIKAARIACERYANLSFITRTVTAKIHNGLGNFNLPYGPVVGDITSISDDNGVVSNYKITDPYSRDLTVVYNAGYTTLPEDFVTAIKNQIGFMYDNRGDVAVASGISLLSKLTLDQVRIDS